MKTHFLADTVLLNFHACLQALLCRICFEAPSVPHCTWLKIVLGHVRLCVWQFYNFRRYKAWVIHVHVCDYFILYEDIKHGLNARCSNTRAHTGIYIYVRTRRYTHIDMYAHTDIHT